MVKLNKKELELEMELAYYLNLDDDGVSGCNYALGLGLIEEHEHCGDCC